jgi:hypothetical protein
MKKKIIAHLLNGVFALCATVRIFFTKHQIVILATAGIVEPFLVNVYDIAHLFKSWILRDCKLKFLREVGRETLYISLRGLLLKILMLTIPKVKLLKRFTISYILTRNCSTPLVEAKITIWRLVKMIRTRAHKEKNFIEKVGNNYFYFNVYITINVL